MPAAIVNVEQAIRVARGQKIMIDVDLAALYQVETKKLLQAVKRNLLRFPDDFMFQLSQDEASNLRSQIVTSSGHGGRRYLPYAFTEQGVAMLSTVLRSERAIAVNIEIMRTFVRICRIVASDVTLADKLNELERKYDAKFKDVFDAIRSLMAPPDVKSKTIGFARNEE